MLLEGGTVERSSELNPEYFSLDRNRLDIGGWQPIESISNAMLFLCSDEGAYVTGVALPVDSGWSIY